MELPDALEAYFIQYPRGKVDWPLAHSNAVLMDKDPKKKPDSLHASILTIGKDIWQEDLYALVTLHPE